MEKVGCIPGHHGVIPLFSCKIRTWYLTVPLRIPPGGALVKYLAKDEVVLEEPFDIWNFLAHDPNLTSSQGCRGKNMKSGTLYKLLNFFELYFSFL